MNLTLFVIIAVAPVIIHLIAWATRSEDFKIGSGVMGGVFMALWLGPIGTGASFGEDKIITYENPVILKGSYSVVIETPESNFDFTDTKTYNDSSKIKAIKVKLEHNIYGTRVGKPTAQLVF